jgi:hypothetical protein
MTDSIIIQQEDIAPLKVVEREILIDEQVAPIVVESAAVEVVTLEQQTHILEEVPQISILAVGEPGRPGIDGVSDHGALTGLGDDDHPQYILGDRAQWADLTDGGETILHTHPGGSGVSNLGDILAFAAAHG